MNQASDNYLLPEGYRSHPVATTNDSVSGLQYWNARRVRVASYYQFSVYRHAVRLIRNHGLRSLLDVGCGAGKKLEYVHRQCPGVEITGVDQPHPIEYCRANYTFGTWFSDDFDRPDLERWPTADLVVCADVIEHVADPDTLLETMGRLCSERGLLLISTPDRDRLYGPGKLEPGHRDHVREWSGPEFAEYLRSRGWKLLHQRHSPPVRLLPTLTLAREIWKQSRSAGVFLYNQICLAHPAKGWADSRRNGQYRYG